MTTLTIEIPEKSKKKLTDLLTELGGKVVAVEKKKDAKMMSQKEKEFIKGFEESIEFVNQHQQGKVKAKSIDQLLNDL